jgi:hypothetical protein
MPPATPAYETTFVRSRMGASHAIVVTFLVAEIISASLSQHPGIDLLNDCRIVQLATTQLSKAAVYVASVHRHF